MKKAKPTSIVLAAEDDPIYKEGWSVSIPPASGKWSPMHSIDMRRGADSLTPEDKRLSGLEQSAKLHRLAQAKRRDRH